MSRDVKPEYASQQSSAKTFRAAQEGSSPQGAGIRGVGEKEGFEHTMDVGPRMMTVSAKAKSGFSSGEVRRFDGYVLSLIGVGFWPARFPIGVRRLPEYTGGGRKCLPSARRSWWAFCSGTISAEIPTDLIG